MHERMAVGESRAKVEGGYEIALDRNVAIQVGFPNSLLIQRTERRCTAAVVYRNTEFDLAGADPHLLAAQLRLKRCVRRQAGCQAPQHPFEPGGRPAA